MLARSRDLPRQQRRHPDRLVELELSPTGVFFDWRELVNVVRATFGTAHGHLRGPLGARLSKVHQEA